MEELTENAEEQDEGESKQSEQKLGKLQYKVRNCGSVGGLTVKKHLFDFSLNMISMRMP